MVRCTLGNIDNMKLAMYILMCICLMGIVVSIPLNNDKCIGLKTFVLILSLLTFIGANIVCVLVRYVGIEPEQEPLPEPTAPAIEMI